MTSVGVHKVEACPGTLFVGVLQLGVGDGTWPCTSPEVVNWKKGARTCLHVRPEIPTYSSVASTQQRTTRTPREEEISFHYGSGGIPNTHPFWRDAINSLGVNLDSLSPPMSPPCPCMTMLQKLSKYEVKA